MNHLGESTVFLTLSASETKWPNLLKFLYELKYGEKYSSEDPLEMNTLLRCTLVNEDRH